MEPNANHFLAALAIVACLSMIPALYTTIEKAASADAAKEDDVTVEVGWSDQEDTSLSEETTIYRLSRQSFETGVSQETILTTSSSAVETTAETTVITTVPKTVTTIAVQTTVNTPATVFTTQSVRATIPVTETVLTTIVTTLPATTETTTSATTTTSGTTTVTTVMTEAETTTTEPEWIFIDINPELSTDPGPAPTEPTPPIQDLPAPKAAPADMPLTPMMNEFPQELAVPDYKQKDPAWINVPLGDDTIGHSGCLVTSMAMLHSYTAAACTPADMASMLSFTTDGSLKRWGDITALGYTVESYNTDITPEILSKISQLLRSGKPVVLGSAGSWQHYIIVTGYTGDGLSFDAADFTIHDPGYNRTTLADHLDSFGTLYKLIYLP